MPKRKTAVCLAILEHFKRRRNTADFVLAINAFNTTVYVLQNMSLPGLIVRNTHIKVLDYYEEWINKYIATDFFALFRMTRITFGKLFSEIGLLEAEISKDLLNPRFIPLEKSLLMTLWYLGKGDTLISIADRFGVSISTTHHNCFQNIKLLGKLMGKYIKWPNKVECSYIEQQFFLPVGYPNVIGAIDGSHINCKVPQNKHDSYANRKLTHSVIIQGICTTTRLYTNVCIGFPGSVHDARVLRESTIYTKHLDQGRETYFFEDYHLIGDSAYPCLDWLMTPYRDTGRLSRKQRNHNILLSRGRVVIEHAFGLLKGRWRILKYVDVYSIEKVIFIICACCVLHNFCLLNNDGFAIEDEEDCNEPDDDNQETYMKGTNGGMEKRDLICNNL